MSNEPPTNPSWASWPSPIPVGSFATITAGSTLRGSRWFLLQINVVGLNVWEIQIIFYVKKEK